MDQLAGPAGCHRPIGGLSSTHRRAVIDPSGRGQSLPWVDTATRCWEVGLIKKGLLMAAPAVALARASPVPPACPPPPRRTYPS
eukprot:5390827-Pyramimonas_sp.AAC.2